MNRYVTERIEDFELSLRAPFNSAVSPAFLLACGVVRRSGS